MGIFLTQQKIGDFLKSRYPEIFGISLILFYLIITDELLAIPLCPSIIFSGIPCPTCGITRSMWNIFHGNFLTALAFNPLGYLAVFLFSRRLLVLLSKRNLLTEILDGRFVNYILAMLFFGIYFSRFLAGISQLTGNGLAKVIHLNGLCNL